MKNILITGTSRGIGHFLAENLKENHTVSGISRTQSKIKGIKEFNIDLIICENISQIVKKLEQEKNKIDVIILNAGVGYFGEFQNAEFHQYREIIQLNLMAPIELIYKMNHLFHEKTKIIFIGSIIAKKFFKGAGVYQASKFGLRGLAGALNKEWKNQVHIIHPKIVETDFHKTMKNSDMLSRYPVTSLESIYDSVIDIIENREKRFEIDL